jgi:signal peptidase I
MSKKQDRHLSVEKKGQKAKTGFWPSFIEMLKIILCAIVIAILIKSFIIDTREIPSTSMVPTIEIGDRVILWRLAYDFGNEPQRGDIIVFKPPAELNEKTDLVKRVIGLPDETVEIKDGYVYINGKALTEDYLNEKPTYTYGPVTVPDGCYFVMGDNRNVSVDSHMWPNPFLAEDAIKGKALCIYWPLPRLGGLYDEDSH